MYQIIDVINDTNGQELAMDAIVSLMKFAQDAGYSWIEENAIFTNIGSAALLSHRSYILRLLQDRGVVVGFKVKRPDGKQVNLWCLTNGGLRKQYNARVIPENEVLS